jgi:signal transduction histidine kinase
VASQHQAATSRHQIQVDSLTETLVGQWDASRLTRVLDNLLANAIKYSPNGGPIHIQVSQVQREDGVWAIVTIQDHGLGIPSSDLPSIFDPFHRASNVRQQIEGSGLGLASARQIVEAHGGTISVSSQEGVGSTFRISLPVS